MSFVSKSQSHIVHVVYLNITYGLEKKKKKKKRKKSYDFDSKILNMFEPLNKYSLQNKLFHQE